MMGEQTAQLEFVDAAEAQRVCAVCGKGGSFFDPHHVVEKKWLKSNGFPIWDKRNALRLCRRCHGFHTGASRRVKTSELVDSNVAYALASRGAAGADYLRRYYDDSGRDPRVKKLARDIDKRGVACTNCGMDYDPRRSCDAVDSDCHEWVLKA